jgi:hypothetical protein
MTNKWGFTLSCNATFFEIFEFFCFIVDDSLKFCAAKIRIISVRTSSNFCSQIQGERYGCHGG